MAVFEAPKGFHLSDDGATPWAHFERVRDASGAVLQPPRYRFETQDPAVVDRVGQVDGVVRIDEPDEVKPRLRRAATA